MDVDKAMRRKAAWVSADTPVAEVARIMQASDIGAVPVGRDDRLIGMITDRDIVLRLVAAGRDGARTTAAEIMTPGIVYCRAGQSLKDAVGIMERRKLRRLPVIDDDRRLVGMLSLGDIAHALKGDMPDDLMQAVAAHHG